MKKIILILVISIMSNGFVQSQNITLKKDSLAMHYASTITVEDLREDLTILASDALEGRETGKRGQKMAAAYIRAHFEEIGLEGPVKTGNGYYQDVPLVTLTPHNIYLNIKGEKLKHVEGDILYYGESINTDEINSEVVFAGNGSKKNFEAIDVKGKAALVIVSTRPERQAALTLGKEEGVEFMFVVYHNSDEEFNTYRNRYKTTFSRGSLKIEKGLEKSKRANSFFISPTVASKILNVSFDKMSKAIRDFNKGKKKALKKIKSKEVRYKTNFTKGRIVSENVLGFIEGSEFKDEVIVMTAHYDHEGIKNGEIYNGADDDGSGTVAIMDIAEAFSKAKADGNGPRRSILFMTVTGEEKGLLGSEYYAGNPIFPLVNTVVNLNMDMIGRIGKDHEDQGEYIRLIGSDAMSTELHNINETVNELYTGLFLDYSVNDKNHSSRSYYRSDHWNFAKNDIPIISYGNGPHADYHKPTDTVDKIEFELLRKRAQLIFYTAWEVANRNGRLIVDKSIDTVETK